MAYEPTVWKTGDVVTSSKLNKLENGVANSAGFLKVTASYDEQTNANVMNKTWQEIYDALANGGYVCCMELDQEMHYASQMQIVRVNKVPKNGHYQVLVTPLNGDENMIYKCDTANDYPSYSDTSEEPS